MEDKQVFIPRDSLVRIYFKNGTIIEGIVLAWNDKKGLLRSPDCSNRMIIYSPAENVMMVKLVLSKEIESNKIKSEEPEFEESESSEQTIVMEQTKPIEVESITDEFMETSPAESIDERTRKLIRYRLSKASSEKKVIAKVLDHNPLPAEAVMNFSKQPPRVETKYYESPNFTQRRPIIGTGKKNN